MQFPIKRCLLFLLFILLIFFSIWVMNNQKFIITKLQHIIQYCDENPGTGAIIFTFSLGISSLFLVPTTYPTIIGGLIFKPLPLAVVLVLVGSQIGIVLSYLLGKTIFRPWVKHQFEKNVKVKAIDQAISQQGWKIVVLLRLTPIFPFGLCNYILSGTSIRLITIMASSLVGNLPGAIMNSLIGSVLKSISDVKKVKTPIRMQLITGLVAVCFGLGSTVFITIIARRAMRGAVDFEEDTSSEVTSPSEEPMLGDTQSIAACDSNSPRNSSDTTHTVPSSPQLSPTLDQSPHATPTISRNNSEANVDIEDHEPKEGILNC
ncbi:snare associated Golgi protein-domain-containing protein [Globomyces pollinis-pini]|nr:snare associated Golgi protein-domain-containing protein [Globomyces pollinis-pini]